MKRASILPGTLPACDARSNAEEAVSHGERTSQRIRHATQTTSRHTKLLVVVQKLVRTIRAKIRLLAVVKRPNLTAHGHAYDRAARDFHSQTGLISAELALAAAASGGVAQACALAALALRGNFN
jgi:hypothetical protein